MERGKPARSTTPAALRENVRQQMITGIGGWSGALITAIPTAVFVIVNVVSSLRPAIAAAVGSALLLTLYRLARKQSVQQALSGLFGVVIAAVIAGRSGEARGYFLFGILTSFAYAVPFVVSLLARRPLVGVLWEFLDPTPSEDATPWRRRRPLFVAYMWATLAVAVLFVLRGSVQLILYKHNFDGWLGFTKIAMGYPLFILTVGFAFLVVRRARVRVTPTVVELPPDPPSVDAPVERSADEAV